MDVNKLFMKADSLEKYINISKSMCVKNKNVKIQLNMSTVLSLKKARDLEIEYFNKCSGHGAAVIIFEGLLEVGRSKTWGLLGKELVSLLQYWLNSTRKQLIIASKNWWSFMSLLLKFIKELRLKDCSLPDLLVQSTSEPLLDLATRTSVEVLQKLEILYCLNLCCADSSREVRFATRHHLESYFIKLSSALAVTGHVPLQRCMLESLLRWLLPRHNASVRTAAAAKWFPDHLYSKEAVDVFLERPWQDFYSDARDFLNVHNKTLGRAVSVPCLQLTIHTFQWTPKRDAWLDINPSTKSLTVLLEPRAASDLGLAAGELYTLVVDDEIITSIKLTRVPSAVELVILVSRAPHVSPSHSRVEGAGEVTAELAGTELRGLHDALRGSFGGKYEALIDLDEVVATPAPNKNTKIFSSSEEDTRFSHPVRPPRRRASAYVIKSASTWKSPSSTSTTSLALLHDRLEALPRLRFNKESVKVAALPDLSIVSEVTELIDSQSIVSGTSYNRPYQTGFKSFKKSEKKSQSDGETCRLTKYLSPVLAEESLLAATIGSDESVLNETIQSPSKNKRGEESDIVDLLLKEALQSKDDKADSGINISENRKSPELRDSDAIEDTPNIELKSFRNKKVTVTKDSESEDCNEIDESQFAFVSVRKKVLIDKHKEIEDDIQSGIEKTFDEEAVEKFFSEHIAEDRAGGIVVSPTLARKINETSSEGDDFQEDDFTCAENILDNFGNADNIEDVAIIDCLNDIIDKVCLDIGKCTDILSRDNPIMDSVTMAETTEVERNKDSNRVLANIENLDLEDKVVETPKKKTKKKKVIKLKFKSKAPLNKTRFPKQNLANKMSPIPESKDSIEPEALEQKLIEPQVIEETEVNPGVCETIDNIPDKVEQDQQKENVGVNPETSNISPKSIDSNAPLIRRRRKLYSPKDEHNKTKSQMEKEKAENRELEVHYLQDDDGADFKSGSKKTPKYEATCYKDIEKAHKRHIRLPRSRKSRGKPQASSSSPKNKQNYSRLNVKEHVDIILADKIPLSPRTIKMNEVFDNLKSNVEKHDDIIVADKKYNEEELAVFNFTSDSEDEDFKKKIVDIKKRISTTTNASGDSVLSRHGRVINKINYSEKPTKTKNVKRKTRQKRPHNLADERMREAQIEKLNTSLINKNDDEVLKDPEPKLGAPPQMEAIDAETDEPVAKASRSNKGKKKKKGADKKKTPIIDKKLENDDRTLSPLPGLVIEKMPSRKDDANDSVCTQVMDKLKKIYREGPDAVDESNTTQNMLLDIEKVDFSQHMYISEDFARMSSNTPDEIQKDESDAKSNTRKNNVILNEDENVIEVITYDENSSKAKHKKKDILNISDELSEKSIATVGKSPINAHGNVDEEPPDNKLLTRNVQSRNLEVEDMDTSIQDYYIKLREEINKPANSSASSNLEIDLMRKKTNNSKCISPIAQVHTKSTDDDLKWLQVKQSDANRNDFDDDNSVNTNKTRAVSNKMPKDDDPTKKRTDKAQIDMLSLTSNGSRNCISPVVSLKRMSYDDISKWLPSRRNSSDSTHSSEKSKKIKVIKNIVPSERSFAPKSKDKTEFDDATSRSNSSKRTAKEKKVKPKTNAKSHYNLRRKSVSSITKIEEPIDCNNNGQNTQRKSLISPIKLFDDIILEINEMIAATPKKVIEHKNRDIKSPILNLSASKRLDFKKSTINSSADSNISSSTRVDGKVSTNTLKRKSPSPIRNYGKRCKVQETIDSGPSMSSVGDWLKRSASVAAAQSLNDCYGDSLQNIMEKLDTTLAEIHQNTSKNFLHLFVEAQRHLSEAKQERRRAMKQVASDVLKEVVSVLDRKFEDLDKRTQEMDSDFMEQLKNRAAEFIREDCKRKRVLVEMLRDDVTAALRQSQDTQH